MRVEESFFFVVHNCFSCNLELKYAAEINSIVPPHQYVPWIVVDVQPLYEVRS